MKPSKTQSKQKEKVKKKTNKSHKEPLGGFRGNPPKHTQTHTWKVKVNFSGYEITIIVFSSAKKTEQIKSGNKVDHLA